MDSQLEKSASPSASPSYSFGTVSDDSPQNETSLFKGNLSVGLSDPMNSAGPSAPVASVRPSPPMIASVLSKRKAEPELSDPMASAGLPEPVAPSGPSVPVAPFNPPKRNTSLRRSTRFIKDEEPSEDPCKNQFMYINDDKNKIKKKIDLKPTINAIGIKNVYANKFDAMKKLSYSLRNTNPQGFLDNEIDIGKAVKFLHDCRHIIYDPSAAAGPSGAAADRIIIGKTPKKYVYDDTISLNEHNFLCMYLSFADTLKDFPYITDDIMEEIMDDKDYNNIVTKAIDLIASDRSIHGATRNTSIKYYDLLAYILNVYLNPEKLQVMVNNPENIVLNHKNFKIFDKIFQPRKFPEFAITEYDFTTLITSNPESESDEFSLEIDKQIFKKIDGSRNRFKIKLGDSDTFGSILFNSAKLGIEDTNDFIGANSICIGILEKIFGEDFRVVLNSGIKSDGGAFDDRIIRTIANIFDNGEHMNPLPKGNHNHRYELSKDRGELNYLDKISVEDKKLSIEKDGVAHDLVYLYVNPKNPKQIKIKNDLPIKKIKNMIADCTYNLYTDKENKEIIQKELAGRYDDDMRKDVYACIHDTYAESKLPYGDLVDSVQLAFLTDLKRGGDMLTARAARASDDVFVTGDYIAASYAILIGCKTVFSVRDKEDYYYYIYNPERNDDDKMTTGGNMNRKIDRYSEKLVSLYKDYLKLAKSGKSEADLAKKLSKLEAGINKLSQNIDGHIKSGKTPAHKGKRRK